jgi:hypothetical protein
MAGTGSATQRRWPRPTLIAWVRHRRRHRQRRRRPSRTAWYRQPACSAGRRCGNIRQNPLPASSQQSEPAAAGVSPLAGVLLVRCWRQGAMTFSSVRDRQRACYAALGGRPRRRRRRGRPLPWPRRRPNHRLQPHHRSALPNPSPPPSRSAPPTHRCATPRHRTTRRQQCLCRQPICEQATLTQPGRYASCYMTGHRQP